MREQEAPVSPYLADELDRGILRILQMDARRPYSAIAADLAVSDQTVGRRYQQLRARAGVRVIGLAQPNVNTQELWVFRIRVGANLNTVAANLARRSDTAWVHCICGPAGLEILSMVYREPGASGRFELLEQLATSPSVAAVTAQSCLHMYFGARGSILNKAGSGGSARREESNGPDRPPELAELTPADHRLLGALRIDGRASLKQLSGTTGLAEETVKQRLERLQDSGVLYFDVDFSPELLGLRASVSIWARVDPARMDQAGRALAEHNEVSFAAATTGTTNVYAVAHCVDEQDLYRYLRGPCAQLPGLQAIETAPRIRGYKKAQLDPAT